MSPGQGKFPSLKGLILHKFNPSKKCLEGLSILPNYSPILLVPIFSVKIEWHFFWRNSSIPPNLFWRNWIYEVSIPPKKFGGIDQFLQKNCHSILTEKIGRIEFTMFNHSKNWKNLWTLRQNLVHLVHIIILILRVVTSFHLHIRNANEVIWQFWDRENSLFVTQGTSQFLCVSQFFPIHGLAVVVKKESSTRGFAARGGFFFHHAC